MDGQQRPTEPAGPHDRLIAAARRQAQHYREQSRSGLARTQARRALGLVPEAAAGAQALPGYRLVEEIHRGGQGIVYRAVQESTGRDVAIKVLLAGAFAGPDEKARFAREVQILAQLRHPNVVTIHDSGEAGTSAYFVMDFIAGLPLDEYVATVRPERGARLRLFARVCHAVNAAHLRGVLHRDLKPGNIRVDAAGEPHVLDFGLARQAALEAGAGELTRTGQFVGTLPWASPEQVVESGAQIDLRTDVYALGVMLYQLLTGAFPYEVGGPLHQTVQNILHRAPTPPRTLNPELDDEIATIALKALRKDRSERYETAGDLGRDIERYLAGEPVEAKRASAVYMLRKQLARHKVAVGLAAAFVVLVTVGFGVSLALWRDAVAARRAEREQKTLALRNAELAEARAADAAAEARRAQAITAFVVDMLATANPVTGARVDITVREAVDAAAARLAQGDVAQDPAFAAAVHRAIGRTYTTLGLYDEGRAQLAAALALLTGTRGEADAERLRCAVDLADTLRRLGKAAEAEPLYRDALMRTRAAEAADFQLLAQGLIGLGDLLRDAGRLGEAEPLAREAVALLRTQPGADRALLAQALNDLALTLAARNADGEALQLQEEAVALFRATHGAEHFSTATAEQNLAAFYAGGGELERAEALYRTALAKLERIVGPEHPNVATVLDHLGRLALRQARLPEAQELLERAVGLRQAALGPGHPLVAHSLNNLATVQYRLGDLEGAGASYAEAIEIFRAARGPEHPANAALLNNLAAIQRARGEFEAAAAGLREALAIRTAQFGMAHPDVAQAHQNLGRTLLDMQALEEAETHLRGALEILRSLAHGDPGMLGNCLVALAALLCERGALAEAEATVCEAEEVLAPLGAAGQLSLVDVYETRGRLATARGEVAAAADLFEQALALTAGILPPTHWRLATLHVLHAAALAEIGRDAEALEELRAAHARLAESLGPDHRQTRLAAQRLAEIHQRAGQPDTAASGRSGLTAE